MKLSNIKKHLNNYSLKTKIMSLIFSIIILTTAASYVSVQIISVSNNRLLYKALAGSLSYSAQDISTKLSNIEAMSSAIISNKDIRKNLISLTDDTNSIHLHNTKST